MTSGYTQVGRGGPGGWSKGVVQGRLVGTQGWQAAYWGRERKGIRAGTQWVAAAAWAVITRALGQRAPGLLGQDGGHVGACCWCTAARCTHSRSARVMRRVAAHVEGARHRHQKRWVEVGRRQVWVRLLQRGHARHRQAQLLRRAARALGTAPRVDAHGRFGGGDAQRQRACNGPGGELGSLHE